MEASSDKKYFEYSEEEIEYLKSRDAVLAEAIDAIGPIQREVHTDLFRALINSIVGQQISTKAQVTIWNRLNEVLNEITPETIVASPDELIQSCGLSFRKVEYMKNAAEKVVNGELDLEALHDKSDEEVCAELSSLKGIGVWTAEMLMTFSMQRKNVISYGDLAIIRGLRMLYHHRKITPQLFAKYRRRYSPYASVASLYLWAIAGGAIEGMKDYAPKTTPKKKTGHKNA